MGAEAPIFFFSRKESVIAMKLTDRIAADLMAAMKAREERRLSSLRMLKTELRKPAADKGRDA